MRSRIPETATAGNAYNVPPSLSLKHLGRDLASCARPCCSQTHDSSSVPRSVVRTHAKVLFAWADRSPLLRRTLDLLVQLLCCHGAASHGTVTRCAGRRLQMQSAFDILALCFRLEHVAPGCFSLFLLGLLGRCTRGARVPFPQYRYGIKCTQVPGTLGTRVHPGSSKPLRGKPARGKKGMQ